MRVPFHRRICVGLLLAGWCAAAFTSALAQAVPVIVNFQGRLYDPSAGGGVGGPLTGIQQVEFRIFDNLTGGTVIWARLFPVYCNKDGVFNVMLNDQGTTLNGTVPSLADSFEGANRFLDLTVQGHGTAIAPRQQIVSAPYAFHAKTATSAQSATGGFTVNGGLQVQSGGATISGARLTANNGLTVSGGTSLSGGLTNSGGTTLAGGAIISNGLTVAGGETVSGNVTVNSGTLTVNNGRVTANQGLTVNNGVNVSGDYAVFNDLILAYGGAEIHNSFISGGSARFDGGLYIPSNGALIYGGLDAYGPIHIYNSRVTLTKGATLPSDGFVMFMNHSDINVTIGDWNIDHDSMGTITVPGFKGQVVTWSDCDWGAEFFPLSR